MFKKLIIGACASLLIIVAVIVGSRSSEDTLILGTMSGWPPFVSIGPDGSYEGLDIDIANIIAQRLGKKLAIRDMDTVMLIKALDQGRVDFIMTGLDITPERRKRMTMIRYGLAFMVTPLKLR